MYKLLIKKTRSLALLIAGLIGLNSCIENDIPYPRIHAEFLGFEVEGLLEPATINKTTREVLLKLADTVDVKHVSVRTYQLTDSAHISPEIGKTIDLGEPRKFTLSIYQDYEWTVKAEQVITRSFKVGGQVGNEEFDVANRVVVARVAMGTPLGNIRISELKLGPSNASISPAYTSITDFTTPQKVTVTYRDITEEWTLYVLHTSNLATTVSANGWVTTAWVEGTGVAGADNGFEVRPADSNEWTKVPAAQVIHNGGNFKAQLIGLAPQTSYICRAYSGSDLGEELSFTTDSKVALTNGSFDEWSQNGKIWNPWADGMTSFWDTGNKGATTLGDSNTYPTNETASGSGKAAKLETRFIGLAGVGKLAAGNLFVGEYMRTDGTNGILNLGRSFTSYPTKLRIHYKYTSKPIDYTSTEFAALAGKPDTCSIYIALGDWSAPMEIRTKPSERKLFDVNDPRIIAYGSFNSGKSTAAYQELDLKLDYRATDRKPSYLIIVCSASKYGDYFTGGSGSTLWIDNFELLYD